MSKFRFNILYVVLIIYIISSFVFSNFISSKVFFQIISPIFWIITTLVICRETGNNHGRFSNLDENKKTILILTLFYIIIYYLSGLVFTYARSPYSHKITVILINSFQLLIPIIGIEYARSYVINENKGFLSHFLITLLFIIVELDITTLLSYTSNNSQMFEYIGYNIIPLVFSNILYTYLVKTGSYRLSLIYRLIIEFSYLVVPIMPSFDWFMKGIFAILSSVIVYIVFRYYSNRVVERDKKKRKKTSLFTYVPFLSVIILFVLFMAGVFVYEPIAILSNSMVPVFSRGDVVIYRKLNEKDLQNLQVNTIIVYSREGQAVVHRIVNKYYKKGTLYYVTKGDANESNDMDPVETDQIIGSYSKSIKYIGFPTVWLDDIFKHQEAKVEIK